ncbi:MAG: calcium/sodium antiporter [Lepagella sp.]
MVILNILLLVVSLAMILYGASWLTDGGSAVAKRFGMSEMVIGLTIVAFGTSAPELVISLVSALKGSAGLAIGNVVGSNIANVLLIVGVVALVRPIRIEQSVLTREIPFVVLASTALLAAGNKGSLDGGENIVTRVDGIMLLLFFMVFLRYTFSQATKVPDSASEEKGISESKETEETGKKEISLWRALLMIGGGLAALIWGGDIFVDNASRLAFSIGISEAVVGLTIVAVGTSLPELATSVVAAIKGHSGMAVGNVIGSCLFNILFVLGASAVITPLPLGGIGNLDMLTMTGAALMFWIFGWKIGDREITRIEGGVMTLCYITYIVALLN